MLEIKVATLEVDMVDEEVPMVGTLEAGGVVKVEKQYCTRG